MPLPHCALPGPPACLPALHPLSRSPTQTLPADTMPTGLVPGPAPSLSTWPSARTSGLALPHPTPPRVPRTPPCCPTALRPAGCPAAPTTSRRTLAPRPGFLPAALTPRARSAALTPRARSAARLSLSSPAPTAQLGRPRGSATPCPPGPTASQARAASISPSCLSPHQSPWPLQAQLPHRARPHGLRDNLALLAWHSRPLAWPG